MPNRGMLGSPTTPNHTPLAVGIARGSTITATTRLPTEAVTTMADNPRPSAGVAQACRGCQQLVARLYQFGPRARSLQDLCGECVVVQIWQWESDALRIPISDMPARMMLAQDRRAFRDLMHRTPAAQDES